MGLFSYIKSIFSKKKAPVRQKPDVPGKLENSHSAWREEDTEFLRQNWRKMSDKKIAKLLGRSQSAIVSRRSDLGFVLYKRNIKAKAPAIQAPVVQAPVVEPKRNKPGNPKLRGWEPAEDELMLQNYDAMTVRELAQLLGRSKSAVHQRYTKIKQQRENSLRVVNVATGSSYQ